MTKILLITLIFLIVPVSRADTLYRWVDKEGKVHYGDRPAEDAVRTEKKRFSDAEPQDEEELPYSVRKAKQDFPVTLYLSFVCASNCKKAVEYLDKRGIPYTERKFSTQDEAEAARKQYGVKMIPSLQVGKTLLSGFLESQWGNELDLAGYPKSPLPGMKLRKKQAEPAQPDAAQNEQPSAEPAP